LTQAATVFYRSLPFSGRTPRSIGRRAFGDLRAGFCVCRLEDDVHLRRFVSFGALGQRRCDSLALFGLEVGSVKVEKQRPLAFSRAGPGVILSQRRFASARAVASIEQPIFRRSTPERFNSIRRNFRSIAGDVSWLITSRSNPLGFSRF